MKLLELLKQTKYKTCPYCKKQIRKNAVRCKHCGRWIEKTGTAFEKKITK